MLKVHPEPESNYSMRIPLIAVGVTAVGILVLIIMILFSWRQLRTFFRSSTSEGMGKSLLVATHRNGQTFLTWHERTDQSGELYRIYRSTRPMDGSNFQQAQFLAEVGENSAVFYLNRSHSTTGKWFVRYHTQLIIEDGGDPLPAGRGLFVWTVSRNDLAGKQKGYGYYAVTVKQPGGKETLDPNMTVGPIPETIADPAPVEITTSPGVNPGAGGHVYIQFMDFRHWNPTFHAPNPGNNYYGLSTNTPGILNSLQYAYDYTIYEPTPDLCNGKIPKTLPVYVFLHGWRDNRYTASEANPYPYCAYGILPLDVSQTWYFGFAKNYDYRLGKTVPDGDVIVNFTEQRILRMIYDLERFPPGPAVDTQRIYVFGHSMGGSGALAFAERYPNVFAAAYAGQPITNFLTAGKTDQDWVADVSLKWGSPNLNLPISISSVAGWADHLQKYNGVCVWDWQNYESITTGPGLTKRLGEDMVPFGIDHGLIDKVILWSTQGQTIYPILDAGLRAWSGVVTNTDHEWSNFLGMPPTMGLDKEPFWNFQVIRDESVPGLSNLSGNSELPPSSTGAYNQTILWSASWNPWDGAPQDRPGRWSISLCAVAIGKPVCGSGKTQTVDITPRRVQNFVILAKEKIKWENQSIVDGRVISSGTVTADDLGLITVRNFKVSPSGNRLVLMRLTLTFRVENSKAFLPLSRLARSVR